MNVLMTALNRLLPATPQGTPADPAQLLMQGADERAGQSPQEARELREAAQAWLSVVR